MTLPRGRAEVARFAPSCYHRRPMERLRREGRRLGERWAVLTCGLSCGEAQGCKLHTIEKPRANGPWLARRPPDHDNRIRVASPSGSFRLRSCSAAACSGQITRSSLHSVVSPSATATTTRNTSTTTTDRSDWVRDLIMERLVLLGRSAPSLRLAQDYGARR
jgi:hypothetical protein